MPGDLLDQPRQVECLAVVDVVRLLEACGKRLGAGAQTRMGTAVFWGMLVATLVGVFLIPGLFAMMENLGPKKKPAPSTAAAEQPAPAPAGGH